MKSISSIIVLTLVVCFVGTAGAQTKPNSPESSKKATTSSTKKTTTSSNSASAAAAKKKADEEKAAAAAKKAEEEEEAKKDAAKKAEYEKAQAKSKAEMDARIKQNKAVSGNTSNGQGGDDCSAEQDEYNDAMNSSRGVKSDSSLNSEKRLEATRVADINLQNARTALTTCRERQSKAESKQENACNKLKDDYDKIVTDYPYPARKAAEKCMGTDDGDSFTKTAANTVGSMLGQTQSAKPGCSFKGAKTSTKDEKKDIDKEIKDLDKDIKEADKKLLQAEKENQQALEEITNARDKLKDNYEEAVRKSQQAQTDALESMQNQQAKISESIQQIKSSMITARQNIASVEMEMKNKLTSSTPNLRSEASIKLYCEQLGKKQDSSLNNGKQYSNSTKKGAERQALYKRTVEECISNKHEERNTITQAYQNSHEQRVDQLNTLTENLATAEANFKKAAEKYNEYLTKNQTQLNQSLQKYYTEDNKMAQKYNQQLENNKKEVAQITQERNKAQMMQQSKYNSQGEISTSEGEEILSKDRRLKSIVKKAIGEGGLNCKNFPDEAEEDLEDAPSSSANR